MTRSFSVIQKACGWTHIYQKMISLYGIDKTTILFNNAFELQKEFQLRYQKARGINKGHINAAVAVASLYLPLSQLLGKDKAVEEIARAMKPASVAKHNKIQRLPPKVFIKVAGFITGKVFGEKAGFKRNWHNNTNREKRYDLLTCPYVQVFNDLGCPEVCPAVCIQDDISFGNMKNGVIFERHGTLGRGDKCCDFWFRIGK